MSVKRSKSNPKRPAAAGVANAMWGGRFATGPDRLMEAINASIGFDRRLYAQDIAGSKAHSAMLAATGIISQADADAIHDGLDRVLAEIEGGSFSFKTALEDIHLNIESRLAELIGDSAGRLHTARSRNDQVATDLRLWLRDMTDGTDSALRELQAALIAKAEAHHATVMPGFTHLQAAQPVTLGHHMLAYVEMFGRDRGRFRDARTRLNECPLGAGALAGTSFPIDRHMTATALGFDRPAANSLDAVSDRDFVLEYLAAAAICATHLSRLGEELVIWSSAQFAFARLSDRFTTGSSMMPQKRNPDAAELIRGKSGRVFGALMALLTVMKGLPLTYSKDMQEDKEPLFDAVETLSVCIAAATGMVADLQPDEDRLRAACTVGFVTATDFADWLVQHLGMPFRRAHHVTGALVQKAEAKGCDLAELSLEEMREVEPAIDEDVYRVLSVDSAVGTRTSYGGTAPVNVLRAVAKARDRYLR